MSINQLNLIIGLLVGVAIGLLLGKPKPPTKGAKTSRLLDTKDMAQYNERIKAAGL